MRKIVTFLLLAMLLAGCTIPYASAASPTPIPVSDMVTNAGGKYHPTPTPFQPQETSTAPILASTPLPVNTPFNPTPTLDTSLVRPPAQVNILLMGSDWRPNQGFRTDVLILVSINPRRGTITVTSFPRDLYVAIPGIGYERINTTQEFGGFYLTQATFMGNFNVPLDYYVMTNFYGFKQIIDSLGGITVNANARLTDECSLSWGTNGYCSIYPGPNPMDGETALWYVRSRHSSSDFDRTRRAREVVLAMFQKLMSLDALNRAPELYKMFSSAIETNLPLDMILRLLPMASKAFSNPEIIEQYAIGPEETSNYIVPETGAMVLIPDYYLISEIIRQALYQ